MFKQKPNKNMSISLEQRTEKASAGLPERLLAYGLLAAAASGIGGCMSARYFEKIDPSHATRAVLTRKAEFGKEDHVLASEFIRAMNETAVVGDYKVPDSALAYSGSLGDNKNAFDVLVEQNTILARLSAPRAVKLLFESLDRNVDYDFGFKANVQELESISKDLVELKASLAKFSYSQRQALSNAFEGSNVRAEFDEMVKTNSEGLDRIYQLLTAVSAVESIEGNLANVHGANVLSADILKSRDGFDQYGNSSDGREGMYLLDQLLSLPVEKVISKDSLFARIGVYDLDDVSSKPLRNVYDGLMEEIRKEAKNNVDESLHRICNKYLASALSIASEALLRGDGRESGVTNEQYQALIKVITKDAYDAMMSGLGAVRNAEGNWEGGSKIEDGGATVGSFLEAACPLHSFYVMLFDSPRTALSFNKMSPEGSGQRALEDSLIQGYYQSRGLQNASHFIGSTSNKRMQFVTSIVSSLLQVGAAGVGAAQVNPWLQSLLYDISPTAFPQWGPKQPVEPSQPPVYGGSSGGPGTG